MIISKKRKADLLNPKTNYNKISLMKKKRNRILNLK